jgi:hypothetical protein
MNTPRWAASSRPTVPGASPRVDADDVYTIRRTPARAAARTTVSEPSTLTRNSGEGSARQNAFIPATW